MSDLTVLRPGEPKYAVGETVYARVSATKGFVEPLVICSLAFDPSKNSYIYEFYMNTGQFANSSRKLPTKLFESELITLCEALNLQLSVIQRESNEIQAKFTALCPEGFTPVTRVKTFESDNLTKPPAPLFGYNSTVYLRDTAESVGRLEPYRVSDFAWDNNLKEWLYSFIIKPRPERNMTVGDRGDLRRTVVVSYHESALVDVCEALYLSKKFYDRALIALTSRRSRYCPEASASE